MFNRIVPFFFLLIGLSACVDEVIYVDELSPDVEVERSIAMPLVDGVLILDDFADGEADSVAADSIFFYSYDDLTFDKDISVEDFGEEGLTIDYLNIHYTITSEFPVALNAHIVLVDSVSNTDLDIVYFSGDPNVPFLVAAEVDPDGFVLRNEVQSYSGAIELDEDFFIELAESATHLVIKLEVPPLADLIMVLRDYKIEIKLGIEGSGRYLTTFGENEE